MSGSNHPFNTYPRVSAVTGGEVLIVGVGNATMNMTVSQISGQGGAYLPIAGGSLSTPGNLSMPGIFTVSNIISTGTLTIQSAGGGFFGPSGQALILRGGTANNFGTGASVSLIGGSSGASSGAAGDVVLTTGLALGNSNAANIVSTLTLPSGSGTHGNYIIHNLPTADPSVTDALWASSGVIVQSGHSYEPGGSIPAAGVVISTGTSLEPAVLVGLTLSNVNTLTVAGGAITSAAMTTWLLSLPTAPQPTVGWWNNSGIPSYS